MTYDISGATTPLRLAIESGQPVAIDTEGKWYLEDWKTRFVRRIMMSDDQRIARLIEAVTKELDLVEHRVDQKAEWRLYPVANALCQKYPEAPGIWRVRHHVDAIAVRLKFARQFEGDLDEVFTLAHEWKQEQTHYLVHQLSAEEKALLEPLKAFPEFLKTLKADVALRHHFFVWTLRDGNPPEPFIHLPATVIHILESDFLSRRLGVHGLLRFDLEALQLFVRCEGGEFDLRRLDQVVRFKHGLNMTVADLFEDFRMRSVRVGNLEAFPEGIANHNNKAIGPYLPDDGGHQPVSLDRQGWWNQLKPAFRWSKEQLLQRLGQAWNGKELDLSHGRAVFSVVLNTENYKTPMLQGNHGYLLAAIPDDHGEYAIYPFGKFTQQDWPQTLTENLHVAFSYLPASINYPDENVYYSNRFEKHFAVSVTAGEAQAVMDRVRDDIVAARGRKLPFQLFTENCLKWAIDVVKEHIPAECFQDCWDNPFDLVSDTAYGRMAQYYVKGPKWLLRPLLDLAIVRYGASMTVGGRVLHLWEQRPWASHRPKYANPSVGVYRSLKP